MQPFKDRYGLRACMVAPTKIIAGLGMSLHMEVLSVAGATGCRSVRMQQFAFVWCLGTAAGSSRTAGVGCSLFTSACV